MVRESPLLTKLISSLLRSLSRKSSRGRLVGLSKLTCCGWGRGTGNSAAGSGMELFSMYRKASWWDSFCCCELPWADSDDRLFTNKQTKASTGWSSEPVRTVPVVCLYEWEFWKAAVCKDWCCLSRDAHGGNTAAQSLTTVSCASFSPLWPRDGSELTSPG